MTFLITMLAQISRKYRKWKKYIKADVVLMVDYRYNLENKQEIVGFYFYSKARFSKRYQFHSTIDIKDINVILSHIQKAKAEKRTLELTIYSSWGEEVIYIWKSCLGKVEERMIELVEEAIAKNGNTIH